MLFKAPNPTLEQLAEIQTLEAEKIQRLIKRQESFDSCDTDGFVSQWADGLAADLKQSEIDLLKNGGYAQFPVLIDKTSGQVIATEICYFKNNYSYRIDHVWKLNLETANKIGRRFIPSDRGAGTSRIQKNLGLTEELRWFPAYAAISSRGTGLSGAANAQVILKKREDIE